MWVIFVCLLKNNFGAKFIGSWRFELGLLLMEV